MSYTEDQLLEQPAKNLSSTIGWQTLDCYIGRDNVSEVNSNLPEKTTKYP